jgi:hypothetical protein
VVSVQAQIHLDHWLAECGGPVLGGVSWTGNGKFERVGVVLRYRTEGRGDVDADVVARYELGTAESGQTRFRLDVPPLGPVTYHGRLLRVLWQVAVYLPVNKASAKPGTGVAICDLTVAPHGWTAAQPTQPPRPGG